MQRADVNRDKKMIIVRHTRKRDGSLGLTKNKKPRPIPLVQEIAETLRPALSPYQFVSRWGRPYSHDYLRDVFNRACDAALGRRLKLKNASRHSWGMQALERGFDMYKVSKGFGHSSTKMTEHYAKILAAEFEGLYDPSYTNPIQTPKRPGGSS